MPITVVVSKMPMHGRLRQWNDVEISQDNTTVTDPLGRFMFKAGPYVRGDNVDALQFRFASGFRPWVRLVAFHQRLLTNGSILSLDVGSEWFSLLGLADSTRPHATGIRCGGSHSTIPSHLCRDTLAWSNTTALNLSVQSIDLPAVPHGNMALFTNVSAMELQLRTANTSVSSSPLLLPLLQGISLMNRFSFTFWSQPSTEWAYHSNYTFISMYGWCNSTGVLKQCEKVRFWLDTGDPSLPYSTVGVSIHCGSSAATNWYASGRFKFPPVAAYSGRWIPVVSVLNAHLTEVTLYLSGVKYITTGFADKCPPLVNPSAPDAIDAFAGFNRAVLGSRVCDRNVHTVTGETCGIIDDVMTYVDHTLCAMDDIRVYIVTNDSQIDDIVLSEMYKTPRTASTDNGATLLHSLSFDNPASMFDSQPPFLENAWHNLWRQVPSYC